MKALKILLITVLALGMSTGYAGADSTENDPIEYDSTYIAFFETIQMLLTEEETQEVAEGMAKGNNEYCATGDLQAYKQNRARIINKIFDDGYTPDTIKKIKHIHVGIGSAGLATTTSAFFLKRLSKLPRIGIGVAGVLAGVYGAVSVVHANMAQESLYGDDNDLVLKKVLDTRCKHREGYQKKRKQWREEINAIMEKYKNKDQEQQ